MSSFHGALALVDFITGGETGKIECPLEFMVVWQWEKKNKTGHNGSVEETFLRSLGGFHVLPNVRSETYSTLHTGCKGQIILSRILFLTRNKSTKLQFI